MIDLEKLATDVANKVQDKVENTEDKHPSMLSPQFMAETGMDALEIAIRKFIAQGRM